MRIFHLMRYKWWFLGSLSAVTIFAIIAVFVVGLQFGIEFKGGTRVEVALTNEKGRFRPRDTSVRGGAVSFLFDGIHAHDISQVLDEDAVCVRAGHHCAKPLMRQLGVPATTRASVYVYNDERDVDLLVEALAKAQKFFTP